MREQSKSNTTYDAQSAESSSQKIPSAPTTKPQVSALGAGLIQTPIGGTQVEDATAKNALESADLRRAGQQRQVKSGPADRTRSSREPATRDQALGSQNSNPLNQLVQTSGVYSQTASEDTCTLTENAATTQQPGASQIAETAHAGQPGQKESAAVTGDLAIAMQIRTGTEDRSTSEEFITGDIAAPKSAASPKTVSSLQELGSAIGFAEKPAHNAPEAIGAAAPVIDTPAQRHDGASTESSAPEAKPANAADFQSELENLRTEPVRGAHVQIAGDNNAKVDVRLFERNGALSVTVRSGDPTLTRALQEHAPELTARLSSDHFRSESWTPRPENRPEPNSSREGSSQKNDTGAQGEQSFDGRRGNKGNQQQPDWIEELEAHPVPFFRKG